MSVAVVQQRAMADSGSFPLTHSALMILLNFLLRHSLTLQHHGLGILQQLTEVLQPGRADRTVHQSVVAAERSRHLVDDAESASEVNWKLTSRNPQLPPSTNLPLLVVLIRD